VRPALAWDLGWQLSVLATWALVTAERPSRPDPSLVRRALRWVSEALVASVRVAVGLVPLVVWTTGRTPVTACVVNVLAAPLGEVFALPATLALAAVGNLLPLEVVQLLGVPVRWILAALYAIPSLAERLPGASVALPTPTPAQCLVATLALALALAAKPRAKVFLVLSAALVVGVLERDHRGFVRPRGVLRVTALDVGQGDAILVDLPDGEALLVDAGGPVFGARLDPGERAVVPSLALRRRGRLAVVALSHPHPDHAGGLPAVFAQATVGAFWDTNHGARLRAPRGWHRALAEARARGVPVLGPEALCGPPRPFHGATLEVLAPCPAVSPGLGANDGSFVLRLAYGRASVLLPGDLESRGEAQVLQRLSPCTALKAPHHGSRTSSSEALLERVRPRVVLVSAGHPSPFGHPHPEVLARYARRGIAVRRTDLEGAVSVTLHPDGTFEHGQARAGR
jgi:competence protein ComEC